MPLTIQMPKLGYDMTEGRLVRWLKHEGDPVARGEPIAEIETDKMTLEAEADVAGIIRRLTVAEGTVVAVGTPIVELEGEAGMPAEHSVSTDSSVPVAIGVNPAGTAAHPPRPTTSGESAPQDNSGQHASATPIARRLARELHLDLATIRGTGPEGRITREDVLQAREHQTHAEPAQPASAAAEPQSAGAMPMTRMQLRIARQMAQSKTTIPHVYVHMTVDMTNALALQRRLRAEEQADISINDCILAAAARALRRYPRFNATFVGDALQVHQDIGLCLAVAVDDGLVTPVLRHADQRALVDIAREARRLADEARRGHGRAEDYDGGTFTVSNLGMFGVDQFLAIINPPQVAILAVGAVQRVPTYVEETLVPRAQMQLAISADHRVIDGVMCARYLAAVRQLLEEPEALLNPPAD